MGYEKVTGIISKETNTGDADRFLTILTFEAGRIECFAKSIRKQKSKLSATAGLFCYGEYQLFNKNNRSTLTSGKLTENFYEIRNDIVRLTYAIHFLEVSRDVILEGEPFPEALKMLLNSLYMLSYTEKDPEIVSRVFELRMMSLSGFTPVLERCVNCGKDFELLRLNAGEHDGAVCRSTGADMYFSAAASGVLCGDGGCKRIDRRAVRISEGTRRALKHITQSKASEAFNFTVSEMVRRELSEVIPKYLRYNMDREYSKLDYLNQLTIPENR